MPITSCDMESDVVVIHPDLVNLYGCLIDLARQLAIAMDRPDIAPVHAAERAVNPVPTRLAATDAAAADLGFRTEIPFEEGIADLVAWWRRENRGSTIGKRVS